MCCGKLSDSHYVKLRGDVHVEHHDGAKCGEPPPVPERPVLGVVRVIWTVPGDQVRVSLGFGRKLGSASLFGGGCRETLRLVPYASM